VIPELGNSCLAAAFAASLAQCLTAFAGAATNRASLARIAWHAAIFQVLALGAAYACLTWSFAINDFSVAYVAANSNADLPLVYRLTALWGEHEGSLLLWSLLQGFWTLAAGWREPKILRNTGRTSGILGLVSVGFIGVIFLVASPFEQIFPVPLNGTDLNPLLQDPAMALHPPLLYAGYSAAAIPFSIVVANLFCRQSSPAAFTRLRPWINLSWAFLTLGIATGSGWAYYELGWGGWWFWDPLENASLMPWLMNTALMHSAAVTSKRGLFAGWTTLMAIAVFALSLIGTFLARSGILISVHTFATDPGRGFYLLTYFSVLIAAALIMSLYRVRRLSPRVGFKPFSRESFLLLNNVLLSVATGLVFIGTFYPVLLDALELGHLSVGQPYFEFVFLIPMLPLIFAAGFGLHTGWGAPEPTPVLRRLAPAGLLALTVGVMTPLILYGTSTALTSIGIVAGAWLIITGAMSPARITGRAKNGLTRHIAGMHLAHLGLGLIVLGITVSGSLGIESDNRIGPGESLEFGDYAVQFVGTRELEGPNYRATRAEIKLFRNGDLIAELYPEKRLYTARSTTMTETAIDTRWHRDVLVALGDELGRNQWSIRLQYKPLVRLIWVGAGIMALGGFIAVTGRRHHYGATGIIS
jgi:cytochrome c-type biogenesis protein CcmF